MKAWFCAIDQDAGYSVPAAATLGAVAGDTPPR